MGSQGCNPRFDGFDGNFIGNFGIRNVKSHLTTAGNQICHAGLLSGCFHAVMLLKC